MEVISTSFFGVLFAVCAFALWWSLRGLKKG